MTNAPWNYERLRIEAASEHYHLWPPQVLKLHLGKAAQVFDKLTLLIIGTPMPKRKWLFLTLNSLYREF